MRIKTKTTTHNEVEQASNIFETYALQFYLKHLCQNASSDFSRVASGGGPRTFCAPSWVMLQQAGSDREKFSEKNL